jgi:hypothetical protein
LKLAAGNPNLKKAALRVNPEATLESFTPTTGDKVHAKYRTGFVPSVKDPDAVPPNTMSVWEREAYVPDKTGYVRAGANDHLTIKSRGL